MELGSTNLPELDPFAEFSTLVSGDELADQSLPDEEYLQSSTNERLDSDDSECIIEVWYYTVWYYTVW